MEIIPIIIGFTLFLSVALICVGMMSGRLRVGEVLAMSRWNYTVAKSSIIGYSDGREYNPEVGLKYAAHLLGGDEVKILGRDKRTKDWVVEVLHREPKPYERKRTALPVGLIFRVSKGEVERWESIARGAQIRVNNEKQLRAQIRTEAISSINSNNTDQKKWCTPNPDE